MEKKNAQIAVHMSDERKLQVTKLAEANGLTVSEYVCCLISKDLESELLKFRLMQGVFGSEGMDSSIEN